MLIRYALPVGIKDKSIPKEYLYANPFYQTLHSLHFGMGGHTGFHFMCNLCLQCIQYMCKANCFRSNYFAGSFLQNLLHIITSKSVQKT